MEAEVRSVDVALLGAHIGIGGENTRVSLLPMVYCLWCWWWDPLMHPAEVHWDLSHLVEEAGQRLQNLAVELAV